jgi:hypothetical protein
MACRVAEMVVADWEADGGALAALGVDLAAAD